MKTMESPVSDQEIDRIAAQAERFDLSSSQDTVLTPRDLGQFTVHTTSSR
jgi:hypothetical protein